MNIKSKFLELTSLTYIYGTEHLLENHLPTGFEKDQFGNYFYRIGDSKTMFTCHLDTATTKVSKVKHVFSNNIIKTDGNTILGADDKAGMIVLLYMIEKQIPGLYYFFIGEEVGCIGSNSASSLDFSFYKRCISFDRRGYHSIITHQLGRRCCSENFSKELSKMLFEKQNLVYESDSTGIVTDSAMFTAQIQECTNISVGYFNEHTSSEFQDIAFLKKLCQACVSINWESLPTERSFNSNSEYRDNWGPADEEFYDLSRNNKPQSLKVKLNSDEYLVSLKRQRILKEKRYIEDWVFRTGNFCGEYEIEWDGNSCHITFKNDRAPYSEFIGNREELMHVIDDLCNITLQDLNILEKLT